MKGTSLKVVALSVGLSVIFTPHAYASKKPSPIQMLFDQLVQLGNAGMEVFRMRRIIEGCVAMIMVSRNFSLKGKPKDAHFLLRK